MRKLVIFLLFANFLSAQYYGNRYYSTTPVNPDTGQYSPEYQAVLTYAANNGITTPSDALKAIQDQHMRQLVDLGLYNLFQSSDNRYAYYVMNGDSSLTKEFMGINWIDTATYYAAEVDTVNYIPFQGVSSDGTGGHFRPNYIFRTHDTSWIYNDFSLGAYIQQANSATAGTAIGGSTGNGSGQEQRIQLKRVFITVPRIESYIGGDQAAVNGRMRITDLINQTPELFTVLRNDSVMRLYQGTTSNLIEGSGIESETTAPLPSRYGEIGILANLQADYANQSDTINPTSITANSYFTDTLTHVFIAPNLEGVLGDIQTAITTYNGGVNALNDTVNITSNLYLQGVDSNKVLSVLPRRNDQFGMEWQPPRAHPDSFKIYHVTNAQMRGGGSFLNTLDSAQEDGLYSFVLIESSGLVDTNFFDTYLINEDKGMWILGQFAPSPGFRVHGLEINISSGSAPVVIQHMRFGAGTDTLQGVPRDSIYPNGWTQYSERDCLKSNNNYFIFDHNTVNFSTDELMQSRGSYQTYSNNLFSKPLAYNFHHKGEHPKGTIHFKQNVGEGFDIAITRNMYVATADRTPQLGGQVRGVLQEVYSFYTDKAGTQLIKGGTYPDDTLEGMHVINGNHLYFDFAVGNFAFRFSTGLLTSGASYFDTFDIDGIIYPDPVAARCGPSGGQIIFESGPLGSLCASFEPDSFIVSSPVYQFKQAPLIPNYKFRKYIRSYTGARPQDRDTVERKVAEEVRLKQRVDPPKNMDTWLPLLQIEYQTPTYVPVTLPADSLTTDSTGYLGIERLADSLHWQLTYPPSVPYQPIPAAPSGAFLYEWENHFGEPNDMIRKETGLREITTSLI